MLGAWLIGVSCLCCQWRRWSLSLLLLFVLYFHFLLPGVLINKAFWLVLSVSCMAYGVGEVLNCCCLGMGQYVIQALCRLPQLLTYSADCQSGYLILVNTGLSCFYVEKWIFPSQTWGEFRVCSPTDLWTWIRDFISQLSFGHSLGITCVLCVRDMFQELFPALTSICPLLRWCTKLLSCLLCILKL